MTIHTQKKELVWHVPPNTYCNVLLQSIHVFKPIYWISNNKNYSKFNNSCTIGLKYLKSWPWCIHPQRIFQFYPKHTLNFLQNLFWVVCNGKNIQNSITSIVGLNITNSPCFTSSHQGLLNTMNVAEGLSFGKSPCDKTNKQFIL